MSARKYTTRVLFWSLLLPSLVLVVQSTLSTNDTVYRDATETGSAGSSPHENKQHGNPRVHNQHLSTTGRNNGIGEWETRHSRSIGDADTIRGKHLSGTGQKKPDRTHGQTKPNRTHDKSISLKASSTVPNHKNTKRRMRGLRNSMLRKSNIRGRNLVGLETTDRHNNLFLSRDHHTPNKQGAGERHHGSRVRGSRSTEIEEPQQTGRSFKKKGGFLSGVFKSPWNIGATAVGTGLAAAGIGAAVGGGIVAILCIAGVDVDCNLLDASTVETSGVLGFTIAATRIPNEEEIKGIVEQIDLFYTSVLESAFPNTFQSFKTTEDSWTSTVLGSTTTSLVSFNADSGFTEESAVSAQGEGRTRRVFKGAVDAEGGEGGQAGIGRTVAIPAIEEAIRNADLNVFLKQYIPNASPEGSIFHGTTSVILLSSESISPSPNNPSAATTLTPTSSSIYTMPATVPPNNPTPAIPTSPLPTRYTSTPSTIAPTKTTPSKAPVTTGNTNKPTVATPYAIPTTASPTNTPSISIQITTPPTANSLSEIPTPLSTSYTSAPSTIAPTTISTSKSPVATGNTSNPTVVTPDVIPTATSPTNKPSVSIKLTQAPTNNVATAAPSVTLTAYSSPSSIAPSSHPTSNPTAVATATPIGALTKAPLTVAPTTLPPTQATPSSPPSSDSFDFADGADDDIDNEKESFDFGEMDEYDHFPEFDEGKDDLPFKTVGNFGDKDEDEDENNVPFPNFEAGIDDLPFKVGDFLQLAETFEEDNQFPEFEAGKDDLPMEKGPNGQRRVETLSLQPMVEEDIH